MEGSFDILLRGLELSEARTDLTRALENRSPLSVVQDIVQRCPGVLHEIIDDIRYNRRIRPLLDALTHGADLQVVKFLVEQNPQLVRELDGGNLPVHIAAKFGTPGGFAAFQHLVELWPESVQFPNAGGDLPLHLALDSYKPWNRSGNTVLLDDRVRYILDKWPPAIRIKGSFERIPLHLAICRGVPPDALGILLDAWPESIHESAKDGASIWEVFSEEVTIETVEFLVGRDESIVDARSAEDGSLAVHLFAEQHPYWGGNSLDFVHFLVGRRPELVTARDNMGCLPIHRAAAIPDQDVGHYETTVEYLVEQRPETLAEKNQRGALPLHVAVAICTRRLGVVEFLVAERPEALQEGDNDGNLPIHVAASAKRPRPGLIRFLAEQNPDSLLERNNMGLSPLHLVVVHAAPDRPYRPSVEAARILVENCPDAVTLGNFDDVLPVHLAAHCGDSCLDLIEFFAGVRPDTVMSPSHDGWRPLHCAAASAHGAFEVVKCLVERGPGAVMMATTDSIRRLPLHCALAGDGSLSDVTKIALNAGGVRPDYDSEDDEDDESNNSEDDDNDDDDDLNEEEGEDDDNNSIINVEDDDDLNEEEDDDDDDDENNDDNNNDNNNSDDNIYEDRETRLLELVRLLVDKAPASLQVQDAHGMIPLAVAALNPTTPLDVLFFLTKSWPSCVHTMSKCSVPEGDVGITSAHPGPSHPLTKRRRRAYDDADKDAAAVS